ETKPSNHERTTKPLKMPRTNDNFLTAIDVGSAKTCVLVVEITDNGLRYRGHGLADSRGSRKGIIVDLEKAVASIQKAVEKAEDSAGFPVERAVLGVAGSHVRGINTHGGRVSSRSGKMGRKEIRQAVEKARNIQRPPAREAPPLPPQEFILDDQTGVHDPLGMIAPRLEVRVHMISAATSAVQNV